MVSSGNSYDTRDFYGIWQTPLRKCDYTAMVISHPNTSIDMPIISCQVKLHHNVMICTLFQNECAHELRYAYKTHGF